MGGNWKEVLAESDRQTRMGIEECNRALLHGLSINTGSFDGIDKTADDAVDLRSDYKERCQTWQQTVGTPSQSEATASEDNASRCGTADDSDRDTLAPDDSFSAASRTERRRLEEDRRVQWGRGKLVEAQWTEESIGTGGDVASGVDRDGSGYEMDMGTVDDGVDEEDVQQVQCEDDEDGNTSEMEVGAATASDGEVGYDKIFGPITSGKHEHLLCDVDVKNVAHQLIVPEPTQRTSGGLTIKLPPLNRSTPITALASASRPHSSRRTAEASRKRLSVKPKADSVSQTKPLTTTQTRKKARVSSSSVIKHEQVDSDEEQQPQDSGVVVVGEKRKRGRPSGTGVGKKPLRNAVSADSFSVSVFVNIEMPQVVVPSTTQRGSDKLVRPPTVQLGPLQIHGRTSWDQLLEGIGKLSRAPQENLVVSSMRWTWSMTSPAKGRNAPVHHFLPLGDGGAFEVLHKAIRDAAAADSLSGSEIILITMAQPMAAAVPQYSQLGLPGPSVPYVPAPIPASSSTRPASLQVPLVPKRSTSAKKSAAVNELLQSVIAELQRKHIDNTSLCDDHPGHRCFVLNKWHFDLDNPKLVVWATALINGTEGVDYDKPPIGHPFFGPTQANKSSSAEILARRAGRHEEISQQFSPAVAPVPSSWYGPYGAVPSNTVQLPSMAPTGTYLAQGPHLPPSWSQNTYYGTVGPSYIPAYSYPAPPVPPPIVYTHLPSPSPHPFASAGPSRTPHGQLGYPMHGAPHM